MSQVSEVTEHMCKEDSKPKPHCIECKEPVETIPRGGPALQNYRVGADGLCRHINCNDLHAFEPRYLQRKA